MRRSDELPIDPEVLAELAAIDSTLRGERVSPEHAEVAEMTVLVAAERPAIDRAFAAELDERIAALKPRVRPRRAIWTLSGLATATVGALLAVVVLGSGSGPNQRTPSTLAAPPSSPSSADRTASTVSPSRGASTGASAASAAPPTAAVSPPGAPGARKVEQGAQLTLSTAPTQVENVSNQVFGVVHTEGGFVSQSNVTQTGGSDGYAQFQLSIPSSNLSDAMARLSRLHGAQVASRTDTTQDVNDQYVKLTRQLADDQALRTSLLKQLANASSPQQVSSVKAQIADAEAAIGRDQRALNSLNHQINYSAVSLTVSAESATAGGSRFGIGRAAHDAGRVLTVAAGVGLIALAVLVPLGLIVALLWWARATVRRRRREQALDLA